MRPGWPALPLRAALAAALTILTGAVPSGERLPVRTLTTADGLPRDQIACVDSDPRGFVWLCTAEGLTRWDGHTAVTFGAAEGLTPPAVRSFLRMRSGRYWIGTDAGLFEFAAGAPAGTTRFAAAPRSDGQPTATVYAIIESRDGTVWAGTGEGLTRLDDRTERRLQPVDIGMPSVTENDVIVRALVEDNEGTLWIGAGSGVYARSPGGRTRRVAAREGLPDEQVWSLAIGRHGTVWVGTRSGLVSLDREAVLHGGAGMVQRVYTTRDGLPSDNIRSLHANGDSLWIGAVGGLAEARPSAEKAVTINVVDEGYYAWDVLEDGRGDVWIATEAGARRLRRRGFTTYTEADGLGARNAASIFVTPGGEVCATLLARTLSVACFTGTRFTHHPVAATRGIREVGWGWSQLVWQDRRGRWWVPTGEGLLQLPPGPAASLAAAAPAAAYDRSKGLASSSIVRLFESSDGRIWVATWAEKVNGLAVIDPDSRSVRTFTAADGLPDPLPAVFAIAESARGVWIGLQGRRVLRYRDGLFQELPLAVPDGAPATPPLPSHEIRSLLVDTHQRLWIASNGSGLWRIDDPDGSSSRVTWYGTSQGLSSNTVLALAEHASGDIVVATGRAVDRLQPDTGRIAHYSADEGVPRGEILGAARDRVGHVWLATTSGVARLASLDAPAVQPPVTVVTAVRVGGIPVGISADGARQLDGIRVDAGVPAVEIHYVSPGARTADGLLYQYRLTDGSQSWVTTDARMVTFAAPSPGRYRFQVRAILASGIIGEPAAVEFTMLAPVWRRGWFLALLAGGLAATAFAFHRSRIRQAVAVERLRSQIAADLHDGVGASLSRIAILSEVVRQQAATVLPEAIPALAAIGDNARTVIDDMSDAVWLIDPKLDNLQQVVARIRVLATELFDGQRVGWTVDAPADAARIALTSEQRRHLYLIAKEALTNVLRHAQATHVSVTLVMSATGLRLEVIDDGRGIDEPGRTRPRGGRGLDNLRLRAAAVGGHLSITARDGGRGTIVAVEIPAVRPHDHAVGSL